MEVERPILFYNAAAQIEGSSNILSCVLSLLMKTRQFVYYNNKEKQYLGHSGRSRPLFEGDLYRNNTGDFSVVTETEMITF